MLVVKALKFHTLVGIVPKKINFFEGALQAAALPDQEVLGHVSLLMFWLLVREELRRSDFERLGDSFCFVLGQV